jgi:hypothetical protein
MNRCPDCKNEFLQPFICTTCGAEKLYDTTLATAQAQRDKAVADVDHFFALSGKYLERANDAEAQRDKLVAALAHLQSFVRGDLQEYDAAEVASIINVALKECGK